MSSEQASSSKTSLTRRLVVTGAKLAVSIALLWLLFSRIDVGKLWANARQASLAWMTIALGLYALNVVASVWRWWLLLEAQDVDMSFQSLFASMSVALFFNNFLQSNIGGEVVRVADSAKVTRSKTLAATVVLADRTMGMMGLMLVGALMLWAPHGVGWILRPLLVLHPEWVAGRIGSITATLQRFRNHVGAVATCFAGAVCVQLLTVAFG